MTWKKTILLLLSVRLCTACQPTVTHPSHTGPDIFVTGYAGYGTTLQGAVYWKNGVLFPLTGAQYASAIAFSDTDVYIAGNAGYALPNDGGYANEAVYWKNGNMVKLGNPPSLATSIAVSGSDVYVAGYAMVNNVYVAAYWKNGTLGSLGNTPHSGANAIAVSGADVYIAGMAGDNGSIATYWKNGVEIPLENSTASGATSLALSGNDVYVAGYYTNGSFKKAAVYWKNGERISLNNASVDTMVVDSYASAIAVSGTNVHVSGYMNAYYGLYWKDGLQTPLNNPMTSENITNNINSIALSGSDVYISLNNAQYWKNGSLVQVGNGYATAIGIRP